MEIRLASLEDANIIAALNTDVQSLHAGALPHIFKWPSEGSFPAEDVAVLLQMPNVYFYLACENSEPIGYIYLEVREQPGSLLRYPMRMVYVHHISVRPENKHQGCGRALMECAEQLARENEISTIALDVWAFNAPAQAFFAREGFEPYNIRMWKQI